MTESLRLGRHPSRPERLAVSDGAGRPRGWFGIGEDSEAVAAIIAASAYELHPDDTITERTPHMTSIDIPPLPHGATRLMDEAPTGVPGAAWQPPVRPDTRPASAIMRDVCVLGYGNGMTLWGVAARNRDQWEVINELRQIPDLFHAGDILFVTSSRGAVQLWVQSGAPPTFRAMAHVTADAPL